MNCFCFHFQFVGQLLKSMIYFPIHGLPFITITYLIKTEIFFGLSFPGFLCLNQEWFSYG